MDRNKKKKSEWFVILLIILFFTIPVYAMAVMNETGTIWPKCPTSLIYHFAFN